jgi:hypothetical protein
MTRNEKLRRLYRSRCIAAMNFACATPDFPGEPFVIVVLPDGNIKNCHVGDHATNPLNKWREQFNPADDLDTNIDLFTEHVTQEQFDQMNAELLSWAKQVS